jgi:putative transposase
MPQSLTKLYAHLIFSTKNRQPFLDESIRPRVHAYLATVIRSLDSPWVVVGGVADHVHIPIRLRQTSSAGRIRRTS